MAVTGELKARAAELADVQLFSGLDAGRLGAIAAACEPLQLAEGEHVIREGEAADCFYILLEGTVRVLKKLRLPLKVLQAEERMLTQLTGADKPVLGETALLGEALRRSSVQCTIACRLYRIGAGALRAIIDGDPVTGRLVYSHLAAMLFQRLEQANSDVVKLSAALVFALEE
jgi:CRP/FNR family transcriptional regulator, cyclic AMP receptor protein